MNDTLARAWAATSRAREIASASAALLILLGFFWIGVYHAMQVWGGRALLAGAVLVVCMVHVFKATSPQPQAAEAAEAAEPVTLRDAA